MPTLDQNHSSDILIIGAGLAGLTAALHLAERGLQVTVLEADPQYPGGRLAGKPVVELDGWSFPGEHGVHGIWSGYINLQAMLVRHHIRPVLVPAQQEDWFYRRGNRMRKAGIGNAIRQSWIPAPFHYLNLFLNPSFLATIELTDWLMLFNVWSGLLFAIGIDPLREEQPLEGMTMQDVTGNWSPATRALFVGLARNGFAGNPEEIPLSGFLAFLRFYTVMRRDAWAFSYLPGDGASKLINPMVARLAELGGRLVLGARVAQIVRKGLQDQENLYHIRKVRRSEEAKEDMRHRFPQISQNYATAIAAPRETLFKNLGGQTFPQKIAHPLAGAARYRRNLAG